MFQTDYFDYAENKDLRIQIAHLPYQSSKEGERYVFTVVLPNEGVQLNEVEQKLNSNLKLRQQMLSKQNTTSTDLLLYLPKFKLETKYELQDILLQLGMEHAFSDTEADFEGIIGKADNHNRIGISKVNNSSIIDRITIYIQGDSSNISQCQ
jgi:serpin B